MSVVSNFGQGTSPILSQSIQCTSSDNALSECDIAARDQSQCQHVAGIICEGLRKNIRQVFVILIYTTPTMCTVVKCLSVGGEYVSHSF